MAFDGQQLIVGIGTEGYNGNQNVSQALPGELIQAENVTYEYGTLQKEPGTELYSTSSIGVGAVVLGGYDWIPTGGVQRSVIVSNQSQIRRDDGSGTYATILRGLPNGARPPVFVSGGVESGARPRKLFIYTSTNQIQVLVGDGLTTTDIANPAVDWTTTASKPYGGCIHANRHWVYGGQNVHYLYASDPLDHENFTNASAINLPVYPGVGERIIAITSFKGHLLVWKYPRGIFYLDTSAAAITSWYTVSLSHEIGLASETAWCPMDDDILFMDTTGSIHLLSAVLEYGDYGLKSVSDVQYMRNFILNSVNRSQIVQCQAVFYLAKREANFALPAIGQPWNSLRIKVDFNRPDKIRFAYSTKQQIMSIWLARDSDGIPRLTGGDWNGQVWKLDQPIKAINKTQGFVTKWQTPHLDFSDQIQQAGAHRKNFKFLELIMEPEGNWAVTIDVYLDGRYSQTLSFYGGQIGATLGTFILDKDVLGATSVINIIRRMYGSGKHVSLVGTASGPGQDFSVSKAYFYFKIAGESVDH